VHHKSILYKEPGPGPARKLSTSVYDVYWVYSE